MSVSPYICLACRASGIKPPWSPHFFSNTAPAMADSDFLEEPDPTSPYPAATVWSPKRRAHAQGLVNVTILRSGDGIHFPHPGQMVSVHYDAFIVNGKQWDSTRGPGRGQPLRFRLGKGQVIPGLDEGIEQVSLGGKARVVIPAHLAYGKRGFPGLVPPDTDVIFDVELTDVDGHLKR